MDTYFDQFFEEKDLPYQVWDIEASDGAIHIIDSEIVIEAIGSAPCQEQEKIRDTLIKIDFANGDVMHYLKYLARALIETCAA